MIEESNKKPETIDDFRKKIDVIDDKILRLLQKRIVFSAKIAFLKNSENTMIYNSERERDIIQQIIQKNNDDKKNSVLIENSDEKVEKDGNVAHVYPCAFFGDESLRTIFSEIISACRQSVKITRAGFLGPKNSFSHIAALEIFGSGASLKAYVSIEAVFCAISSRETNMAVVPIENSQGGPVVQSIDCLANEKVHIIYEFFLPINLTLLSREKDTAKIEKIYSHPQALLQSRMWLKKHFPDAELLETSSTSQAAMIAVSEDNVACIGPKKLATMHPDLLIKKECIEDSKSNTTRFVVISPDPFICNGKNNVTTCIVSVKHNPGALAKILKLFADSDLNLINIFSRPSQKRVFEYIFFIDFLGNAGELKIKETLDKVSEMVIDFKFIGTYPRGVLLNP